MWGVCKNYLVLICFYEIWRSFRKYIGNFNFIGKKENNFSYENKERVKEEKLKL